MSPKYEPGSEPLPRDATRPGVLFCYGQPYTLHPTPYTLHPTPYTLHPTTNTLHLPLGVTPPTLSLSFAHTLALTPYTLNP